MLEIILCVPPVVCHFEHRLESGDFNDIKNICGSVQRLKVCSAFRYRFIYILDFLSQSYLVSLRQQASPLFVGEQTNPSRNSVTIATQTMVISVTFKI